MAVLPGAEAFHFDGDPALGQVGVVLCHGFTGSPASMRPWGEHLAAAGLTVAGPRLPGHGTTWQEMNATGWQDWYGELERTFDDLRTRCTQVFAMGLSMGGTLTLRLAEQRGAQVAGIVLVNVSLTSENKALRLLPVLKHVVKTVPPVSNDIKKPGVTELAYDRMPVRATASLAELWRRTRADLGKVSQPTLVFRSRVDHVVEPVSGRLLLAGLSATEIEERILENSYHVATLDHDAPAIYAGSLDFVRRHLRTAADPARTG